ncbi:unnamed protein product, partial [Adineta ricciae]
MKSTRADFCKTKMLRLDLDTPSTPPNFPSLFFKYFIASCAILFGLLCLSGFIIVSIKGDINSSLLKQCKTDDQSTALCFLRLITTNAMETRWDKYVMTSLLLTYASVFLHIIVESSRTNVSSLLGQMIIQTICIIFGIGVAFPILFIPSYIYFYKLKTNSDKSPVPIDILCLALVYIICMIIVPTYLIYFLPS